MAKDKFYFDHDYNARNDDKILELRGEFGAEGYGVFWMLIESMAENANGGVKASLLGGLSLGYGVAKEKLVSIINFCLSVELLYEEDQQYFSKRLLEHKEFRAFLSEKGREGAEKRYKNGGASRGAMGGLRGGFRGGNAKERKGKEINKGEKFAETNDSVIFPDGTTQELGRAQKDLLSIGELKPCDVIRGLIN